MHEYYGNNKLKWNDARPSKSVDLEDNGRHHNVNVMLKHIRHKIRRQGGECIMKAYVLDSNDEKTPYFSDGYKHEANTLYKFHEFH